MTNQLTLSRALRLGGSMLSLTLALACGGPDDGAQMPPTTPVTGTNVQPVCAGPWVATAVKIPCDLSGSRAAEICGVDWYRSAAGLTRAQGMLALQPYLQSAVLRHPYCWTGDDQPETTPAEVQAKVQDLLDSLAELKPGVLAQVPGGDAALRSTLIDTLGLLYERAGPSMTADQQARLRAIREALPTSGTLVRPTPNGNLPPA